MPTSRYWRPQEERGKMEGTIQRNNEYSIRMFEER